LFPRGVWGTNRRVLVAKVQLAVAILSASIHGVGKSPESKTMYRMHEKRAPILSRRSKLLRDGWWAEQNSRSLGSSWRMRSYTVSQVPEKPKSWEPSNPKEPSGYRCQSWVGMPLRHSSQW
jgi:hypothetical protein